MSDRRINISHMIQSKAEEQATETRRLARLIFVTLTVSAIVIGGVMVHRIGEYREYIRINTPQ